eukprot:NODE_664_length_1869_cov_8.386813_g535_i0.p1 GENE.NODE_664_length_1869_cov_8.386813_g535_i0~~NODE_664_length_1869_cov_8.386813_g535_i0.p1  ORF type:complete len:597 (-),score=144.55 NODE_664_length_1869_cov_8.386813_g535_i0:78-1748(-)
MIDEMTDEYAASDPLLFGIKKRADAERVGVLAQLDELHRKQSESTCRLVADHMEEWNVLQAEWNAQADMIDVSVLECMQETVGEGWISFDHPKFPREPLTALRGDRVLAPESHRGRALLKLRRQKFGGKPEEFDQPKILEEFIVSVEEEGRALEESQAADRTALETELTESLRALERELDRMVCVGLAEDLSSEEMVKLRAERDARLMKAKQAVAEELLGQRQQQTQEWEELQIDWADRATCMHVVFQAAQAGRFAEAAQPPLSSPEEAEQRAQHVQAALEQTETTVSPLLEESFACWPGRPISDVKAARLRRSVPSASFLQTRFDRARTSDLDKSEDSISPVKSSVAYAVPQQPPPPQRPWVVEPPKDPPASASRSKPIPPTRSCIVSDRDSPSRPTRQNSAFRKKALAEHAHRQKEKALKDHLEDASGALVEQIRAQRHARLRQEAEAALKKQRLMKELKQQRQLDHAFAVEALKQKADGLRRQVRAHQDQRIVLQTHRSHMSADVQKLQPPSDPHVPESAPEPEIDEKEARLAELKAKRDRLKEQVTRRVVNR